MTQEEADLLKRLQEGYKLLANAYTRTTGIADVYFFFGVRHEDLDYVPSVQPAFRPWSEVPTYKPIPSRVFICNNKGDGSVDVQSENLIYCNGPGSYAKAMKMFPGPAVVIPVPQGLEATQDGTADGNSKGDR